MLKAGVVGIISFWFIFDILRLERENEKTEDTIKHISKKIEKLKFKNSGKLFVFMVSIFQGFFLFRVSIKNLESRGFKSRDLRKIPCFDYKNPETKKIPNPGDFQKIPKKSVKNSKFFLIFFKDI